MPDKDSTRKIAFVGSYPGWSNRDDVIKEGLNRRGHEVVEVQSPSVFTRRRQRNASAHRDGYFLLCYFAALILVENLLAFAFSLAHFRTLSESDVFFAANASDYSVFSMKFLTMLFGVPLYFDSHGGLYYPNVLGREQVDENSPVAAMYYRLDRLAIRVVDKYVVFTDAMAAEFSETFQVSLKESVTIYCGVDEERFSHQREYEGDVSPDVDILYWGNYISFHGISELLTAAEAHPDREFVFLGDGGSRGELMERAERESLDNVSFEGFVDNETLRAHIDAADLVCNRMVRNPYGDIGIGNKAAEAAYFSKPMLTVSSPAIRELFEDRESAVLFEESTTVAKRIETFYAEDDRQSIERKAGEVYDESMRPEVAADRFLHS